jgi:hypothetical protein
LLSRTPVPGTNTRLPHRLSSVWVRETAIPSPSITLRWVVLPSAICSADRSGRDVLRQRGAEAVGNAEARWVTGPQRPEAVGGEGGGALAA